MQSSVAITELYHYQSYTGKSTMITQSKSLYTHVDILQGFVDWVIDLNLKSLKFNQDILQYDSFSQNLVREAFKKKEFQFGNCPKRWEGFNLKILFF